MSHLLSPSGWGVLAGLTGLAGYIPYLRDAWRRTSDPDPAAWLIWTLEYSVLLAAQAAQHPPWAALSLAALQLAGTAAVLAVLAALGLPLAETRCKALAAAATVAIESDAVGLDAGYLSGLGERDARLGAIAAPAGVPRVVTGGADATDTEVAAAVAKAGAA